MTKIRLSRLALAAVATLFAAQPSQAQTDPAAGGAVGYYYVTGPIATVVGAVVGGFVGDWWYSAGTARDVAVQSGKTKMFSTETPPVQLIGYDSALRQNLRTATFSAASD